MTAPKPETINHLQIAIMELNTPPDPDGLGKLRRAIIDNTRGDLFWIGEILLSELEKETGFKG